MTHIECGRQDTRIGSEEEMREIMKSSGIGGQAVIEGVMMRNQEEYAVAVRKPDQEIEIKKEKAASLQKKHMVFRLPLIRGVIAFIDSMYIGMKTLTYSASFYEEEEEKQPAQDQKGNGKAFKDKAEALMMGVTVILSVLMAVGIFMVLPFFLAGLFEKMTMNVTYLALIEGGIRIAIFLIYMLAISQMKDIRRVFMYHGAEHKTINCLENGLPLSIENVRGQSRYHKRCGTSFMFLVIFLSVIFFMFLHFDTMWLRLATRILLVPLIAGLSYEFIRLAGKSDSRIIAFLSRPGMWFQSLTTREPEDAMIEVAIASIEAVFDWKGFQREQGFAVQESSDGVSLVDLDAEIEAETRVEEMEGREDTEEESLEEERIPEGRSDLEEEGAVPPDVSGHLIELEEQLQKFPVPQEETEERSRPLEVGIRPEEEPKDALKWKGAAYEKESVARTRLEPIFSKRDGTSLLDDREESGLDLVPKQEAMSGEERHRKPTHSKIVAFKPKRNPEGDQQEESAPEDLARSMLSSVPSEEPQLLQKRSPSEKTSAAADPDAQKVSLKVERVNRARKDLRSGKKISALEALSGNHVTVEAGREMKHARSHAQLKQTAANLLAEEEDDEILRALDKYFIMNEEKKKDE